MKCIRNMKNHHRPLHNVPRIQQHDLTTQFVIFNGIIMANNDFPWSWLCS